MKRIKIGLVIIIGCFFLLGLSGSVYATPDWSILNEPCDDFTINSWTDYDCNEGVSSIESGTIGGVTGGMFKMDGVSDGYYVGDRQQSAAYRRMDGNAIPDSFTTEIRLYVDDCGTSVNADTNRFYILNGAIAFYVEFAEELYISNGSLQQIGSSLVTKDTWQTWRFVIDGEASGFETCDVYLDESLVASDVDVTNPNASNDGRLSFETYSWSYVRGISYIDYLRIDEGCLHPISTPEPGTMMLLGSLATGLFGITRIRKKRKGGEKNMRDVSFSKIKTTSLLAALVVAVMLLWGNVAHAVPTEAETWAAGQTGWGTIDGWYELTSTVGSLWVAEISESICGGFQFEYALWNENYDTHCANFKIWNPGGYTLTSITEPTGWSHVLHSNYIQWIASDPYVLEWGEGDGLFGYQVINQNVTVGLVPSDAWDGYFQCPIASGYISGPVPEPGTIMLISSLATGLFGIAAIRKRRS